MKENVRRIFAVCLMVALIMTVSASAGEEGKQITVRMQNQGNSLDYISTIVNSFDTDDIANYPDWYGGSTLDEKGHLVVLIKGDPDLIGGKLLEIAKSSIEYKTDEDSLDTISFKQVKYSYRELYLITHEVVDFMERIKTDDAYKEYRGLLSTAGIADDRNRVMVLYDGGDEKFIELIKQNVSRPDALYFPEPYPDERAEKEQVPELSAAMPRRSSVMKPGMRITIDGNHYSMGFVATKQIITI